MKSRLLILMLTALMMSWTMLSAEELVSVAHVSYLEGSMLITNRDGIEHEATINFPVVSGDILRTNGEGRAEIQFGNGTLVRIDQNSELLVGTILAPLLSYENWNVTTLRLETGAVYVISNTYEQEMLQLVSSDVAVRFPRNTNVEIRVDPQAGSRVISHWGKADLLIVDEAGQEHVYSVKGKNACLVNKSGNLTAEPYIQGGHFWLWNEGVNNHFKALHEGKSFLPDKIVRHAHLQLWAERWSSLFGEWIYDKMFGYIWKPRGDFAMDRTRRPFYNGRLVTINGQQYVVPDYPWAWAPAHLGTWVFLKKWGWTWIPGQGGDIFTPTTTTLMEWLWRVWGSPSCYYAYLDGGIGGWRRHYQAMYGSDRPFDLEGVPTAVRTILHKLELTHPHQVKQLLDEQSDEFINKDEYAPNRVVKKELPPLQPALGGQSPKPVGLQLIQKGSGQGVGQAIKLRHDWNPDRQWASRNRVEILYSSQSNSIIVPQKKLDSANMTSRERSMIFRSVHGRGNSGPNGTYGNGTSSANATASGSAVSSGDSGSGSSSKDKK